MIDHVMGWANTEGSTLYLCANRTAQTATAKAPRINLVTAVKEVKEVTLDEFYGVTPAQPLIPLLKSLRPMSDARVRMKGELLSTVTSTRKPNSIQEAYLQLENELSEKYRQISAQLEASIDKWFKSGKDNEKRKNQLKRVVEKIGIDLRTKEVAIVTSALNKPAQDNSFPPGLIYQGPSSQSDQHSLSQFGGSCYYCGKTQAHIHYTIDIENIPVSIKQWVSQTNAPLFYQYFYDYSDIRPINEGDFLLGLKDQEEFMKSLRGIDAGSGIILCKHRHCFVFDKSGPHRATSDTGPKMCPDGCFLTYAGDHVLSPDIVVMKRGSYWHRHKQECQKHNTEILFMDKSNPFGIAGFAEMLPAD